MPIMQYLRVFFGGNNSGCITSDLPHISQQAFSVERRGSELADSSTLPEGSPWLSPGQMLDVQNFFTWKKWKVIKLFESQHPCVFWWRMTFFYKAYHVSLQNSRVVAGLGTKHYICHGLMTSSVCQGTQSDRHCASDNSPFSLRDSRHELFVFCVPSFVVPWLSQDIVRMHTPSFFDLLGTHCHRPRTATIIFEATVNKWVFHQPGKVFSRPHVLNLQLKIRIDGILFCRRHTLAKNSSHEAW